MIVFLGVVGRQAIGTVYGTAEAVDLLNALSRAGLYLGSAIATASATTIALMLTLIGMIRRLDEDFDRLAYRNVALVARLWTMTLLTALLLLMAFTLPIGQFDDLPSGWFETLYNGLYAASVCMVGLAGSTVVLIYTTLVTVIAKITPSDSV